MTTRNDLQATAIPIIAALQSQLAACQAQLYSLSQALDIDLDPDDDPELTRELKASDNPADCDHPETLPELREVGVEMCRSCGLQKDKDTGEWGDPNGAT
jgi:hypothetical protein